MTNGELHRMVLHGIALHHMISYSIAWYYWLRSAGCISQDTYLLLKNNMGIVLNLFSK